MQFSSPIPILSIASLIEAKIIGSESAHATGINEIHKVSKGDLVSIKTAARSNPTLFLLEQGKSLYL